MSVSDRTDKVGFCTLCRSRCGTLNRVENGRLVSVEALPSHPTGRAICTKGRAAPQLAHNSRRLLKPMRRTRPKSDPDPGWREITWDEALDEIAARLSEIRREHGAEAVAFAVSSPSGTPLSDSFDWIERFNRVFGSPNQCNATEICNWQKDHAHVFTFGCGTPHGEYRNSDLIILWGFNPATSWLAVAGEVEEARKRGAKLMVIDPREAGQAAGADYWLCLRPGTDAALALGLAHLMIEMDGIDEAFVRKWTNAPLLVRDDTGTFLRGADLGDDAHADDYLVWDTGQRRAARYDPAVAVDGRAAEGFALEGRYEVRIDGTPITCRPAFERYLEIVRRYTPERVSEICAIPPDELRRAARALADAKAISYHAWTGISQQDQATQTERAIAVLYALTGCFDARGGNVQLNRQPINRINPYSLLPPGQAAKALGLEQLPVGPPSLGWTPVNHLYTAILDKAPYAVHGLVAFGSNILVSLADTKRGRAAFEALPFHVQCDLFETPTSRYADILLPVNSAWEREGLRVGFEISAEAEELVQLRQQMVPSQGESRSDLSIVFDLAVRLGMGDAFFGGDVEAGWNHMLEPIGLTVDELRRHPEGVRRPVAQSYRKYADVTDGVVRGFATPTRRVELYSERLMLHGQAPLPDYIEPAGTRVSPRYPYWLTTARNGQFCHSQHRSLVTLRRRAEEPRLEIGVALAREKGIEADDWVVVSTRHGRARFRARLNATMQRDTIVAEYGWWEDCRDLGLPGYDLLGEISSSYNDLIGADALDPISGAVAMRSTVCQIEREGASRRTGLIPMIVMGRAAEAEGVLSVTLASESPEALPDFQPGQYVTVQTDVAAGRTVSRAYSLSGPGQRPGTYKISVKRVSDDAIMSSYIHESLGVGDRLFVGPPQGKFRIPMEADFPVILIAAGIGITPFISYLETLDAAVMPEVVLLYGNRNRRSHAFSDRIRALAGELPRLIVHNFYSRPGSVEMSAGDIYDIGRISARTIDESLIARRARFYLCGPEGMLLEMVDGLIERGIPPFEIFLERFHVAADPGPLDEKARYSVRFARTGQMRTWGPKDGNLLRFGEAAGVVLPSGCRTGQCESCAVRILSGRVRHLVPVETDDPAACLTCQAVPASDLVLDA